MVGRRAAQVHAAATFTPRLAHGVPLFPSKCPAATLKNSKLWKDLRPDRDHSDKQRDRGQRSRLFDENLEHLDLLLENIGRTLFYFCSYVKRAMAGQLRPGLPSASRG
jgi:hypothetical protein